MNMARMPAKSSDLWQAEGKKFKEVFIPPAVIGDLNQISSICQKTRVDRILVALDERRGKLPFEQLLFCRLGGIRVNEGVAFTEQLSGKLSVEDLQPSALIFSDGFKRSFLVKVMKRSMDLSLSLTGLILLLPLSLATALAVKLESLLRRKQEL